jgi:hypothetical protein
MKVRQRILGKGDILGACGATHKLEFWPGEIFLSKDNQKHNCNISLSRFTVFNSSF